MSSSKGVNSMIKFEDFSFQYSGSKEFALKDINLQIETGDFVGIIGHSGAGKTTLTYAINGVVPHYFKGDFYGSVAVNGLDTVEMRPEELSRMIGSVFQDIDGQMVASIVEDEILFGLENFGIDKKEIPQRIETALETVGITNLRYRMISSLSGGQKQKVAIAAIVALKPSILILDEPTGELDPISSRKIFDMLSVLNSEYDITIVVVEQKIMLLCEYVEKLIVLDHHTVGAYGRTREVLAKSQSLETMGVNIPRVTTLANKLREKELYMGEMPINMREAKRMVEEIVS